MQAALDAVPTVVGYSVPGVLVGRGSRRALIFTGIYFRDVCEDRAFFWGGWVPLAGCAKAAQDPEFFPCGCLASDGAFVWQGLMGIYTVAILLPSDPLRACHPDEVARKHPSTLEQHS